MPQGKPTLLLSSGLTSGRTSKKPRQNQFDWLTVGNETDHTEDSAGVVFFSRAQFEMLAGALYAISKRYDMLGQFVDLGEAQYLYDGALQLMALKKLEFDSVVNQAGTIWDLDILPDAAHPGTYIATLKVPNTIVGRTGLKFRRKPLNPPFYTVDEYILQISFNNGDSWDDTQYNIDDLTRYRTYFVTVQEESPAPPGQLGRFELTDEGVESDGTLGQGWTLYIDKDQLKGADGTNGTNGKTWQNIHTYKLNPGESPFLRPATPEEQILYLGAVVDGSSSVIPYVAGLVTGDTGAQGIQGIQGIPGTPGAPGQDCGCGEPADPTGASSAQKRCNIATGGCEYLFSKFIDLINQIEYGLSLGQIASVIASGLIDAFPILGAVLDAIIDTVVAVTNAGVASITAAFTTEAKATIIRDLYCVMGDDGKITDAVIQDWIALLEVDLTEPLKGSFIPFLQAMNTTEFRKHAYLSVNVPGVCDLFAPCGENYDWTITLRFKTAESFSGCSVGPTDGATTYVSGEGWKTPANAQSLSMALNLIPTGASTVKQVATLYRSNKTGDAGFTPSDTVVTWNFAPGAGSATAQPFNYPLSANSFLMNAALGANTNNFLSWRARISDTNAHDQYAVCEEIVIRGNGVKPKVGTCTI